MKMETLVKFLSTVLIFPFVQTADGELGMEDDSRNVSTFLHFDTTSKGKKKEKICAFLFKKTKNIFQGACL